MKKVTMSVAALAIAISGYSQTWEIDNTEIQENHAKIQHEINDLIDAITMEHYYGFIDKGKATSYVNTLLSIKKTNSMQFADTYQYYQVVARQLTPNHLTPCVCKVSSNE
jgi:hypothetical protein